MTEGNGTTDKSQPQLEPVRCSWPGLENNELYQKYHDTEWGRPVASEHELFERLSLEAFQSGLSWLTILKRREGFRRAFAGFDPEQVSQFTPAQVEELMLDGGIIRNRAKIEATIRNAQAMLSLPTGTTLRSIIESHHPKPRHAGEPIPAQTSESVALSKELKSRGFAFVGPTTCYAMMQAIGMVNDHQEQCWLWDGNS